MRFPMLINAPERALWQADRLRRTTTRRKSGLETRILRKRARINRVLPKLVDRGIERAATNIVKGKSPRAKVRLPFGLGLSYNGWQSITVASAQGSHYAQRRLCEVAAEYENVEVAFGQGQIIRDGRGRYTHVIVRLTT